MLNGNNFISFDGSEIKGECIEVKILHGPNANVYGLILNGPLY